jgi:MFS family permease
MDFIFSYVYKFLGYYLGVKRDLPPSAKTLSWMIALYDFSFAIATIFINVFLYRQNHSWNGVITFNVIQFLLVPLAFWLGGSLSPRFGHRLSYQLGFIFHALLFSSLLLLRESAVNHTALLGVLSGLAIGFYYLGQHALTFDMTNAKDRDYFFSLYLLLSSLLKIAAPGISGWVVASFNVGGGSAPQSLLGYYLIFGFTLLIYLALIAQSLRLRIPHKTTDFQVRKVLAIPWDDDWKRLLAAWFFSGLRGGLFWFALNPIVYRAWGNELAVGNYNMLATFLAVVTAYTLSRWADQRHRNWGMRASSVLIIMASIILSISMGPMALLFFAVLNSTGMTWFQVGFSAISFNVIDKARQSAKYKLEYLTLRELPLALGRLMGLAGFWALELKFGDAGIRIAVLILGLTQLGTYAYSIQRPETKK